MMVFRCESALVNCLIVAGTARFYILVGISPKSSEVGRLLCRLRTTPHLHTVFHWIPHLMVEVVMGHILVPSRVKSKLNCDTPEDGEDGVERTPTTPAKVIIVHQRQELAWQKDHCFHDEPQPGFDSIEFCEFSRTNIFSQDHSRSQPRHVK